MWPDSSTRTAKVLASSVTRPLSSTLVSPGPPLGMSSAGGTGYPTEYRFSPSGDSGIHDLLLGAIRATRHHIYVEDQYFVASGAIAGDRELLRALAETIARPSFTHLVVLTCGVGTVQVELRQTNLRRRELWRAIAGRNADKISVWAYKGGQDRCYWQHAKTWIFDDELAVVGSANFNRRGLCHDGELAVAVHDPAAAESLPWPHELRVRLWHKHLPTPRRPVSRDQLVDFDRARSLWADTPDTYLARLDLDRGEPGQPDRALVCDPARPRGGGWAESMESWACAFHDLVAPGPMGRELQWDLVLDPDGS
jgi:phosphatidylserine/phosphatidylglycerophosphate/cardiolipin synthase-like enzyme